VASSAGRRTAVPAQVSSRGRPVTVPSRAGAGAGN